MNGDSPSSKPKPSPNWLNPDKTRVKKANKTEKRLAKRMGGRRLPRSGGLAWSKWDKTTAQGDISTKTLHVESKRTEKDSMSVKREWLGKVKEGAFRVGKDPALVITFEGRPEEDWICVPMEVFERWNAALCLLEKKSSEPEPE